MIKNNFLPLVTYNFVTYEIRTLPKTHRTPNIRHMRQAEKTAATLRRRRAFITSYVRSTNKDVSELVLHVQSWPRAAPRKTPGTGTDETNAAREHHNMTGFWRAGHCDNRLLNGFGETPHRTRKNITDKEPEVTSLCSAAHPCATFECIFRRGAFVHSQREHEARPRMTRAPAHRFGTSQRTLRSRSKRKRSAKQRKTSQHHAGRRATSDLTKQW